MSVQPAIELTNLQIKNETQTNPSNSFLNDARKSENDNPEGEDFSLYDDGIQIRNKPKSVNEGDGVKTTNLIPTDILGLGSEREIPDINFYQHKKTLAKGMMDLALFSANANQLRYVLECQDRHPYFYPSMILIVFSLICQVIVGVALLWNAMYNVKHEMDQANRANNCTVIGIFLVTVVNVFISAFGVANAPPVT